MGYGPTPQQASAQQNSYNRPQPALNALSLTDLGNAFQNMQTNFQDPNWYMDTGASSHVTADPGKIQSPLSPTLSTIFVGNGQHLPIKGSGHALHSIPNNHIF